jgi:hypothetical protein
VNCHIHIAVSLGIEPIVKIYCAGIVAIYPKCPTVIGKKFISFTQINTPYFSQKLNLVI